MAIGAKSTPKKSTDAPKPGTYLARLVGIVDLGHQPAFDYDGGVADAAFKLTLTYELPNSKTEDGRPHWVSEDVKNSDFYDPKKGIASTLMKRVYAMDPTGEETRDGKNLLPLIGKPCMVEVGLNKNGYVKIKNVTGAPEGIPIPELANDPLIFDFEEPNVEVFNRFPEFVQNKIKAALNLSGTPLETALLAEGLIGDEDVSETTTKY
jgi:hypothetical protein